MRATPHSWACWTGTYESDSTESKTLVNQLAKEPLLHLDQEQELTRNLRSYEQCINFIELALADAEPDTEHYVDLSTQLGSLRQSHKRIADQLFRANVRLVIAFASRFHRLPFMDQFQWGCIGLIRAIRLFDPDRKDPKTGNPIRFSTYATRWIIQFIQRGADSDESLVRLPVHVRDLLKRITRAEMRYVQDHGAYPDLETICLFTGEDIAKIRRLLMMAEVPISIHMPYDSQNGLVTLEEQILDAEGTVEERYLEAEYHQHVITGVHEALKALEGYVDPRTKTHPYRRHAQVLKLRFRIGETFTPDEEPTRTLEEVGRMMRDERNPNGITRVRARQLQRVAVRWIQEHYPELRAIITGGEE